MAAGTITRKELYTDEALNFGKDYEKNILIAIAANEKLVQSAKDLNKVVDGFKDTKTNKEFVKNKRDQIKLSKEAEQLLISEARAVQAAEKAKQAAIDTEIKANRLKTQGNREKAKGVKLTQEERFANQQANKTAREAAILSSKLAGAFKVLNLRRTQAKTTLQNLIASEKASTQEIDRARRSFEKLDARVKKANNAVRDFGNNVGNYPKRMGGAISGIRNLAGAFGLLGGAMLAVSIATNTFTRVREFNKELANMRGIAGQNIKDLPKLKNRIKDVAGESIKTTNEVAKLATALFSLGKTQEEVEQLLKPINNLGIGLNATSEEAGELLVQTLNAFGKGAESGQEFADTIAKIRTSTALDFERIKDSLGFLAPTAKTLGLTLADTGAILGVLNDNGIKASRAGRLMSSSFLKLAKEGKSLEDALDELNATQASTSDELVIAAKASDLFGVEAAGLGIILADNRDKVKGYAESFSDVGGSLDKLVGTQLESLDAKIKILDSSWEKFILSIEEGNGVLGKSFGYVVDLASQTLSHLANITTGLDLVADRKAKEAVTKKVQDFVNQKISELDLTKKTEEEKQKLFDSTFAKATIKANTAIEYINREKNAIKENLRIQAESDVTAGRANRKQVVDDLVKSWAGNNKEIQKLNVKFVQYSTVLSLIKTKREELTKSNKDDLEVVKELSTEEKKRLETAKKLAQLALDTALFNEKIARLQAEATALRKTAGDSGGDLSVRINAASKLFDIEEKILNLQKEKSTSKINGDSKSEEERLSRLRTLNIEHNEKLNQIIINKENVVKGILKDGFASAKKRIEDEAGLEEEKSLKSIEILKAQFLAGEIAWTEYEQKIKDIRDKSSKDAINAQISQIEEELNNVLLKGNERLELEKQLAELRRQLTDQEVEDRIAAEKKVFELKKKLVSETSDVIANSFGLDSSVINNFLTGIVNGFKKTGNEIADALIVAQASIAVLGEVGRSISQGRIDDIDRELEANEVSFARQIELAGEDEDQRKLLEAQRKVREDALNKKKRKEQVKQAKFEKAIAITQIGISTAVAAIKAIATTPLPAGAGILALTLGLGAVQLAAAAAKPIPKFKDGHLTGTHEGVAITNDGVKNGKTVQEVWERNGKAQVIQGKNTKIQMKKGDKIHSSIDSFLDLNRISSMASLEMAGKNVNDYQAKQIFNNNFNNGINEKAIEIAIMKGFKRAKININNHAPKNSDFGGWSDNILNS